MERERFSVEREGFPMERETLALWRERLRVGWETRKIGNESRRIGWEAGLWPSLGDDEWLEQVVEHSGLQQTLRSRGRPREMTVISSI